MLAMTPRSPAWGYALLLGLAACQPSAADESVVTQRLQNSEDRLSAMELELEAMQLVLDAHASELAALKTESAARPKLDGNPGLVRRTAAIAGAESIACEGFETASIACKINPTLVTSLVDDPMLLATQARFVPSVRDGKTGGYKLYGIRPGSLPKLVGMMNGDTITSVGGKPLDSIDAALDVYAGLRKGEQLIVGIERRGQPIVLTIDVVQ
jgi:hypothetical protein